KGRRSKFNTKIVLILLLAVIAAGFAPFVFSGFLGEDTRLIQDGGEADGRLRVKLLSLGAPEQLTLTLDGVYSLENDPGFRFARGSVVTIVNQNSSLLMDCGGLTIDMGPNFTLTRHFAPQDMPNGIYIAESQQPNMYNGDLYLEAGQTGIDALLFIDMEEYLYGVVPYEMSDSWPLEALKAQAVAARTYAMGRKSARISYDYDVVDTTADQVFKGYNAEWINAIEAVDSTRGIVGMYKGSFATCYYGASNGGQTALPNEIWGRDGDYDYLDVRDDPYDLENSKSVVRTMEIPADGLLIDETLTGMLKAALSERLAGMGYSEDAEDIRIVSVESITPCDPKGLPGSRMMQTLRFELAVEGRKWADQGTMSEPVLGEFERIVQLLEADIGLYSQIKSAYESMDINPADCELYTVTAVYADGSEQTVAVTTPSEPEDSLAPGSEIVSFRLEARRYGHGVGMSQRGAQTMAGKYDLPYTDILLFYYPNMELVRYTMPEAELTQLDTLPKGLGAARVIAIEPKPTPAPLPPLESGEKYGHVVLNNDASALNVRAEPNTACEIISTLQDFQQVIICETLDGWYRIRTAEVSHGYVSARYLVEE
ncbi:MAG: SpoIID/LytB domain-containing protein, partial [Clostridia bacterium]|nr:SpoIID/LytB domain-containing protein [Clostridia bacterium]